MIGGVVLTDRQGQTLNPLDPDLERVRSSFTAHWIA